MNEQNNAAKAYEIYFSVTEQKHTDVTTTQLNMLYNVMCRIKRDKSYATEIAAMQGKDEISLLTRIEKYFEDYNNLYGLDIRETLTETLDSGLSDGAFFTLRSFKIDENGTPIPHSPVEFLTGDIAHVKATLLSQNTKMPIIVSKMRVIWVAEDGKSGTEVAENVSEIEFDLSLSRPGEIKFKITVEDSDGKAASVVETAFGGLLFSKDELLPTHITPEDLVDFWTSEIARLWSIDPRSEIPDGYDGNVKSLYDMPKKNFYKLTELNLDYLKTMRDNAQPTVAESVLEQFDIWDVMLKAPGPCPATAYVSVPKGAEKHSLPMKFVFDGYGVRCPAPITSDENIVVHCSHHGYELGKDDKTYYEPLRTGICAEYGRASGKVNSDYDDIHDCYMTYLNLRNLQMLRFCTDFTLSRDMPLLHEKWNGEIVFSGGSMGGYQAICLGALSTLLDDSSFKLVSIVANVPAFCNLAGEADGRIKTSLTNYADGCDYFDPAHLARLVSAPVKILRVGLGDEVCPASGIVAMFNSFPKNINREINFLQNSSHGYLPSVEFQDWFRYIY